MSELCDRYGISRKTGYKLVHRVEVKGAEGLEDRSRAPHSCPHRTPRELEEIVLAAKQAHPSWRARELLSWLQRRHPRRTLPARSTVADLLARSGWVKQRRTQRRWKHPGRPEGEPKAPTISGRRTSRGSSERATMLGATRSRSPTGERLPAALPRTRERAHRGSQARVRAAVSRGRLPVRCAPKTARPSPRRGSTGSA
ncbi:MAG: helix-turn-helix domain-containing protein [Myxococcota bacterium]